MNPAATSWCILPTRVPLPSAVTVRAGTPLPPPSSSPSLNSPPAYPDRTAPSRASRDPAELLVEDEPRAAQMLAKGLREQAYAVDVVGDGKRAVYQAAITEYDAIVLDVVLPLQDGLAVCRAIRQEGSAVPVLMLTARDAVEARIAGLDSGADDYLTKPFDFGELLARLRAIIRRGRRPPTPSILRAGILELDTRARRARRRGEPLTLTARSTPCWST